MGSVSQRLLVLFTRIPRASNSLQAFSIQAIRSPRLLPSARYAVRVLLAVAAGPGGPGLPVVLTRILCLLKSLCEAAAELQKSLCACRLSGGPVAKELQKSQR